MDSDMKQPDPIEIDSNGMKMNIHLPDQFVHSKKINIYETSRKKFQERQQHAPNCDDINCKGCEIGEIEIVFTGGSDNEKGDNGEIELKPYQLFQLAQEEVTATTSKTNGGGGGGDNGEYNEIAKKLFEMALEGFDKLLLESKLQEKKKNDGGELVVTTMMDEIDQIKYQYALCCITFGNYLPIDKEIQKGVDMLKELVEGKEGERNEDEKNSEFFESWLALGKGQIYLSKLQSSKFDDDNEQENYTISESELNLYSQGIKAFE
ncbi:13678_t:CDS:2 [Entrophospora sp. SA101]|nr:13678_t:CDS:2 [Entrophospora sp. SA101]